MTNSCETYYKDRSTHKGISTVSIKTSGSESRPRKVELANAHKNAMTTESILHITTKLVKTPTKQPYRIDIFIS